MKRIYLGSMLLAIGIGFSACGGGGGGTPAQSNTEEPSQSSTVPSTQSESNNSTSTPSSPPSTAVVDKITIEARCTNPATISEYFELQSADKISKESQESVVKLYHDENNLKYICVESGQAFVERRVN